VWSICLYCLFIALGRTYFALGVYRVRDNLFLTKFYVTTCEGSLSSTYFSYFVKCILVYVVYSPHVSREHFAVDGVAQLRAFVFENGVQMSEVWLLVVE
jgi:hypothetical protein